MTFHNLKIFLFGTLRSRLVISVALIHAVMMTLFIVDLTARQRTMLLDNQTEAAIANSNSLATSAAVWIAANDLSGLQELVEAQRRYPEIRFAILTDENGRILAHTDKSKIGLYILDLPKESQMTILGKSAELVDVAVPAMVGDTQVGWARVGLGQESAAKRLTGITNTGILYAFAAIFIGSVIAWGMGTRVTQRLYVIQNTMGEVKKGVRSARAVIFGDDEMATISRTFNSMLDTLDERDQALLQSESKYRQLVQGIQAAITVHGADSSILMANPMAQKMFGLSEDLILGKTKEDPAWRLLRGDGTTLPIEEYPVVQVLATKKPLRDVVGGIHRFDLDKDIWVMVNADPMFDEDGNITQVIVTFIDITERRLAEEALQKNNNLLERIFSSTEFLIAYMDADFNFIRVNRAYAKADDSDPEFLIGKNHFKLYPNPENEVIFRQVLKTGEPYIAYAKPFQYVGKPDRGTSYWDWTLQPLKEANGQISGLVLSMVDVTEREKAILAQHEIDAQYRSVVEQANDGIFLADPQGNYVDVNPSGCAMLGYTREEILQLNMRDLASAESLRRKPLQLEKLRAEKSILTERTLVAKSGELLPVEISGKILNNGYILGIVRDITDRKRHEIEHNAIITVSAALRQVTSRTETLNVILEQLEELFEADGVVLALLDLENNSIVDAMTRGVVGEKVRGLSIPKGMGVCNWVIENKTPYLTNHAETDPLFYRPDLLGDSRCIAAAPLITQEQAIGALWFARRKEIKEYDLHLLNAIADIAASAIHRANLNEQIEQQVRHLIALHQIDVAITANFNLDVTLNIILKHVKDELVVDAASILLLDPLTYALEYNCGIGFKTLNIEKSSVKLRDDITGQAALDYRTASYPDLHLAGNKFSRSSLLAEEEFASYHVTPLIVKGQIKGVLEVFTRKPFKPSPDWVDYFETLATQTAIAIENTALLENLQKSNMDLLFAYDATIEGWSRALDMRDRDTEGHTKRVTELAIQLAEQIGMSESDKADLRRGALLHDIGKMGVPDAILHKAGPLTESEWAVMRKHPNFAYQMLSPISYLKRALDIPYHHHEKWDGTGYPHGLRGEEIPLAARVFSIVDVFDALTSDRPYRKAWTDEEAYRYIEEQAGKHFDPEIVRVFLENKRK